MFTGIITEIAKVTSFKKLDNKINRLILELTSLSDINKGITLGESIAINGVCLTVVEIDFKNNYLEFDVSKETISCTNFKELENIKFVNLERSLQLNTRLSGHLVTGHIDSVCIITDIENIGDSYLYNFEVKDINFLKYIAPKGSICLDGISLTVNGVKDNQFWVTIIPHTFENTCLKYKKVGSLINFEVDLIARYVNNFKSYV